MLGGLCTSVTLYLILEMLSGLERWLSGEVVKVLAVLVEEPS